MAFKIGLYGVVYAIAILLNYYLLKKHLEKNNRSEELAYTSAIYLSLGLLLGARALFVVYYNPAYYLKNPLEIFFFWQGGMSFHGGLIGIMLAGYFLCKKYSIPFLKIADIISFTAPLFLFLGRIANFLNNELPGKITNVPWCINILGYEGCRHPTTLYDAIKNLFIFAILLKLSKKNHQPGILFLTLIFTYSLGRLIIDFWRDYPSTFLGISSGQYLNLITLIISGVFLLKLATKKQKCK